MNVSTSTLLSDLTSPEVDPHHQEEMELPEVKPERRGERSRSPEPDIQFVQNILRETREILRNQANRGNTTKNYNRGNASNNFNRGHATNNYNRANTTYNSNRTNSTNSTNNSKGRGRPKKE